ncbi:hexosaminidase [Paenibacillus endophyticus]|uniref:Hexosaminidase n=1 Tax=Paenibacillus endophyticus TaxID=1294268 RepID=A0A7W5CAP5_9BACL|nr:family 20 glycosylhydrolase [Paenibacillus endophyticus]MBB3153795.1 hexosaminidase [Paenibacillus endophyticus]
MKNVSNDYLTRYALLEEKGGYVTTATKLATAHTAVISLLEGVRSGVSELPSFPSIQFREGQWPTRLQDRIRETFGPEESRGNEDEAYAIEIEATGIEVYALTARGSLYGAATLSRLAEEGLIRYGFVYNRPICPVRGLKLYMPTREGMDYFKQFIDLLCRFQYNTVVLEVGGAMAYEKHPEINEGWVRYCEEMSEYSGKTIEIQDKTYPWYKNSIHVENGGGSYLTQDEVRELIHYCKERFFEVIPEVPSLSHCDYLLINHPELAERKNDPYPDTYCPSDERSYELLFDVLDEVLQVFEPRTVHVGHDEYYSIGLCERCKGKPAESLYADDLRRIHSYLAERGVQTMIWCEKLIDAEDKFGEKWGGAERAMKSHVTGELFGETIPATFQAINLLPTDIQMLNWYWGMGKQYDRLFLELKMPLIYGNLEGPAFVGWKERLRAGARGGIISNWSETAEGNLQRNGILFSMAYSAFLFWRDDYEESAYGQVIEQAFEALYRDKNRRLLRTAEAQRTNAANGSTRGTTYVEVTHTTDEYREYKLFFDGVFLDQKEYRIGAYTFVYEDGTEEELPICYGFNISNKDRSWERFLSLDSAPLKKEAYKVDDALFETAYTTRPMPTAEGTYYRWMIENPYPNKRISGVRLTVDNPAAYSIYVKEMRAFPNSPVWPCQNLSPDKKS